jgi:hypothetical protein
VVVYPLIDLGVCLVAQVHNSPQPLRFGTRSWRTRRMSEVHGGPLNAAAASSCVPGTVRKSAISCVMAPKGSTRCDFRLRVG